MGPGLFFFTTGIYWSPGNMLVPSEKLTGKVVHEISSFSWDQYYSLGPVYFLWTSILLWDQYSTIEPSFDKLHSRRDHFWKEFAKQETAAPRRAKHME